MRWSISIHKALAGLDYCCPASCGIPRYFNPQGPRGPRPVPREGPMRPLPISIHKALAGLDHILSVNRWLESDFNPQGPRGPRRLRASGSPSLSYFNPQGPRGPRPHHAAMGPETRNFNPQGPRGPRQQNYPTIPPHPPNFLCIMSPPSLFQPPPSIHPAYFHGFSSVFQVRISRTFHVSLAFAPGLMGFRLTEITLYLYTT